ncbi:MAG: DUF3365 domain-containing protein [Desulfobulbaceae bacterium]|nr:DUF3365 domain-containing protein [Desulfobulbaceae bacterium]
MPDMENTHPSAISCSRALSLNRYAWFLLIAWTTTMALLLIADLSFINKTTKEMAITEAEAHFNRDNTLRTWVASHGGIYVAADKSITPNPFLLQIPDRDVVTPGGQLLTLMNPAFMIRAINEYSPTVTDITGHLTSLNPIRPANGPDDWERKALEKFSKEIPNQELLEFVNFNDKPYLRLMRPLITTKDCLLCHGSQGYKEGDIRGGVNINVPMTPFLERQQQYINMTGSSLILLWLLGITGIILGKRGLREQMHHRDQAEQETRIYRDNLEVLVEERTQELKESLEKVKKLKGMLPICASCKKIRDDKGYWNQIEAYIGEHSGATFSHGICPDCAKILYPECHQSDQDSTTSHT